MSRLPESVRKVVCYVRKSREDEEAEARGEDTLAKQREMLVKDVLSQYSVEFDVAEEVASGDSIEQRPVFQKLLPLLGETYQAIVCKDLSRLGRGSYKDMGMVYDLVRGRRVFIITKDAVYDPRNFSDLRMIRFSLFFHREEYEMTLWRLTEGKYDGAARGNWVAGSVPYGYRYNSKTQTLHPRDNEADVVRLIYEWYGEEKIGYRAIASRLTQLGYRTPRGKIEWHPEVVRRILANPAYRGTLVFRKTKRDSLTGKVVQRPKHDHIVTEHAFTPIVESDLWHACQQRTQACNAKRSTVAVEHTESEASTPLSIHDSARGQWALSGFIQCRTCTGMLVRRSSRARYQRRDGQVSVYDKEFLHCKTCRYAIKYRECEQQLLLALEPISISHSSLLDAANAYITKFQREAELVKERMTAQRLRVQARLEKARDFLLDGTLTRSEYLAAKVECEEQLARWNTNADTQEQTATYDPKTLEESIAHVQNAADIYQMLTDESLKREFLSSTVHTITVALVEKGKGKGQPARFDLDVVLQPEVPFTFPTTGETSS